MKFALLLRTILIFSIILPFLGRSDLPQGDKNEQVRAFTRSIEFDYIDWTIRALTIKAGQAALNAPQYMRIEQQVQTIRDYLDLVEQIEQTQAKIEYIYSDPQTNDPETTARYWLDQLNRLKAKRAWLEPLSETIVQQQMSASLDYLGLNLGGQPVPPILYHVTPLPLALIISPRSVIREDTDISLQADMTLPEMIALESQVEQLEDVSALVEAIGGVGIYPTMVESSTDFPWLVEVVGHEWTHNFLTLRPLGMSYFESSELRTMNETAANIAGKEIRQALLERYYPEFLPPPAPSRRVEAAPNAIPAQPALTPAPFDFRKEMHETRVTADQLLWEGKITEAESYMEDRRRFLWDHGFHIRRLNQAYFAFHGAYADMPGGAAGKDPVGPAVRELRSRSASLADFLNRISWMTSFAELQNAIK